MIGINVNLDLLITGMAIGMVVQYAIDRLLLQGWVRSVIRRNGRR